MATPNKWAVREVALATFYDIATGKALLHLENLKTSGLENAAETVYSTGGRGDARIAGFSSGRTATVTLENAVFDNTAIAMMTGNDLAEGSVQVYQRDVIKAKGDSATVTKTPVDGRLISLYILNADGSHGDEFKEVASTPSSGEYSISGKNIVLAVDEINDNQDLVAYYFVETGADAKKITVSSDSFAGSFKLVMDCLVRDIATQRDFAAQIEIPQCKAEDNWSFELSSSGDPSVHNIPLEVLKPSNSTDMWTMTIYSEDDIG